MPRLLYRFDERFCRERLCQIGDAFRLDRDRAGRMIVVAGDKNDRQPDTRSGQPSVQLDAGSFTQIDVENDTEGLVEIAVTLEGLGRVEQDDFKIVLPE